MRDILDHQAARLALMSPGCDRLRSPGDLVARMRPRFREFGITRLAEVTGLDEVGWPVWSVVRPNAPTLSVCQGKGRTAEAAQASALMEAVEISAAERVQASRMASPGQLAAANEPFDLLPALVRRGCAVPSRDQALGWVQGFDIVANRWLWVPAQAVRVDPTEPDRIYWQSSDGLGSGSLMIEAVLHGLYERIERDAGEMWVLRSDREVAEACVDPRAFDAPDLAMQAEAIERAGLHLRLFDSTTDVGVPVYFATVSPRPTGNETNWTNFDLASGMACRLDPARAAVAAIGEALQSRLTTISGARDDYQPSAYRQKIASDILVYPQCPSGRLSASPPPAEMTIGTALDVLVDLLRAVEVDSIVVVPLVEDEDVAVAKVLVTALEHPPGARAEPHGPRLRRAREARR